jgi:hypothetical protein
LQDHAVIALPTVSKAVVAHIGLALSFFVEAGTTLGSTVFLPAVAAPLADRTGRTAQTLREAKASFPAATRVAHFVIRTFPYKVMAAH